MDGWVRMVGGVMGAGFLRMEGVGAVQVVV